MTKDDDEVEARTLTLRVAHPIGSVVYHRMADEPRPGLVTGYYIRPTGMVYVVSWGDRSDSNHFEIELTRERPTFER